MTYQLRTPLGPEGSNGRNPDRGAQLFYAVLSMSHVVLARKYRPKNFKDVVGQDLIVQTLMSAVSKDRLAHAFLFTGSRGVGKTTIARILAKSLVCKNRKDAEPCNNCEPCRSIDDFSSLDVMEIDGASHTSVDDVRVLRENARFQPAICAYKIFIIDEVHMLSISAFNALLKILEEPPEHVIFIFATTESQKIPKTILSRCQRYDFLRVNEEIIGQNLKNILEKEGYVIDDDGIKILAKGADGSIRDSLSMSEQVLALGKNSYSGDEIAHILGVVNSAVVRDLSYHLIKGEFEPALKIAKAVYDSGLDLWDLLNGLMERFRLLALSAHIDDFNKLQKIEKSIDEKDFYFAKSLDKNDLKRLFSVILEESQKVFHAKNPLYALEILLLNIAFRPPIKEAFHISQVIKKLEDLMQNRPRNIPVTQEVQPSPVVTKHLDPLRNLVESTEKKFPLLASMLRLARVKKDDENKKLSFYFDKKQYVEYALKDYNKQLFLEMIKIIYKDDFSCEFLINDATLLTESKISNIVEKQQMEKEEATKKLYEEAVESPVVKEALKLFGGSIAEVTKFKTHEVV